MSAQPTDFNDMAVLAGDDAVKEAIAKAMAGANGDEPATPTWSNPPDPVLPGKIQTPDIPADILPGFLGAMADAVAKSTQTPPAMSVMVALGVLATVLQRRFEVAPFGDDYTEPLALWTLTGMPSGARKTAVFSALTAPLIEWEKIQFTEGKAERGRRASARKVAEKRIERLLNDAGKADNDAAREEIRKAIQHERDTMPAELLAPRLFCEDITTERLQALLAEHGERMAVLSDEAGIFAIMAGLYSGGNANIDALLKGHAGSALRVDRAGREAHVDKPALSFALAIQPGVFDEVAMTRRNRDSGLLARFLYAMPVSTVGKRNVRERLAVPKAVSLDYQAELFRLLENRPVIPDDPRVLPMTEQALELWCDFAQSIEDNQGDGGKYESISDWTSKLPGAVARIAALLELAVSGLKVEKVSLEATRKAVLLGSLLIPHAQAAFGALGSDKTEVDANAIIKWIRSTGAKTFSRRECQKAMEGRFRTLEPLQKALQRLQQHEVVRHYTHRPKGKPASEMYLVNPKLKEAV